MSIIKVPFKFKSEIHNELEKDFMKININGVPIEQNEIEKKLDALYEWICSTPKTITYRVNLLLTTAEQVIEHLNDVISEYESRVPTITTFPHLSEIVTVHSWDESIKLDLSKHSKEVIVDAACGSAVLRGSHVYAPGILGIPNGLKVGDVVSVFADIVGCTKKGLLKPSEVDNENKTFLGNGIIMQTRENIFCNGGQVRGVAIYMTDVISRLPQLNNISVPDGWALLQNLPSIICTRVLNPQPGETILDMCSAPGNKSTHISSLMKGKGILIALDRNKSKSEKLKLNCNKFSSGNVKCFWYNSKKAYNKYADNSNINDGPPFKNDSFDRILLDSPCSALGQRPQLLNKITAVQLRSYVALQRKLFSTAVHLLKPNGILVYSTCTITIAENEGIISWALKTYPCLKLNSISDQLDFIRDQTKTFFSKGYSIDGLTENESECLLRMGPEQDSIGFFIACFTKQIMEEV
ncbi:tRNA (cytosine(72)-C(5))-methyltransferase NSUN6 isoform X2 [Vespa crabro]|uniref:tRNA (cytosine(72)-C(5))-methyltransferase NSUN6 isoform X2 n=1 Tax=Vespa crabro TaxID=7445 RepID=UPI001F0225D9|nr:tRNA (cytosine(72)-C(5))-methyltransferase NSUN6 isoform X2 [Vespa crabro]